MATKLRPFDPAELLDSPEAVAEFLKAAVAEQDPELLQLALGTIARAKGMTQVAKETGLSRESLYTSLSAEGNPTLKTLYKVFDALGIKMRLTVDKNAYKNLPHAS